MTRLEKWQKYLNNNQFETDREDRLARVDIVSTYLTMEATHKADELASTARELQIYNLLHDAYRRLLNAVLEDFTSEDSRERYTLIGTLYGGIWETDQEEVEVMVNFICDGIEEE